MKLKFKLIALCSVVGVLILFGQPTMSKAQPKLHFSGYGNMHYMDHDGVANFVGQRPLNDGFFQLREFSLFIDVAISDAIVASTELEASDNGNSYTANYAYVEIQALSTLNFRIGKVLVPFLSYNENKPNFRQNLMSQPFTAWNIAPVNGVALKFRGFGWSDAGVVANWFSPIGDFGVFDVKFSLMNGLGSNSNVLDDNTVQLDAGAIQPVVRPRDGLIQNEEENELRDNNNNKATVLKASLKTLNFPLDVGFSWYRGAWNPAGDKNLQMYGVHLNWLARNYTIKGEFVIADVEQDAGFDPVATAGLGGPPPINTTTGDYQMNSFYIEGSVIPVHWAQHRYLRLVTRYDEVETNDKAIFSPFNRSRFTLGMELQVGRDTRVRYEWQRSKLRDFARAPMPFKLAGGEEIIQMQMASVIFSF